MKKLFIMILFALMPVIWCTAANGQQKREQKAVDSGLVSLINEFSSSEGFDVVKVSGLGASMLKTLVKKSMDRNDPEERAIRDIISSINRIYIVDYDDCNVNVKDKFNRKVSRYLGDENILMSVKGDGQTTNIYSVVSEDGSTMKNFILHSCDSNALVCLFGTLSMDSVSKLMND